MNSSPICKNLGTTLYQKTWQAMRLFTDARTIETPDEIWFTEHYPVFTQGQAGKAEHLLNPGNIPVIQSDRGGQITYHGPGQLLFYILMDIKRRNITVRSLVTLLEQTVINLLHDYGIKAHTKCNAPGVYVDNAKIAALGLRIRKGCSYHGLSLNVNMDLEPFTRINPCGFSNLNIVQITDFITPKSIRDITQDLVALFSKEL